MSLRSKKWREEVEAEDSVERSEGVSLQRLMVWLHERVDGDHDRPIVMDIDQFMSRQTVNQLSRMLDRLQGRALEPTYC